LQKNLREEYDLASFIKFRLSALIESSIVLVLHSLVEFFDNFISKRGKAFEPSPVFLAQDKDNLQEDDVLFLGFVFGQLSQRFVDVAGFSGEFFSEWEGVI